MFGNGQHATIRRSMGERGGGDLPAHNSDRSSFVGCTARSAHLDRPLLARRCLPAHHSWTGVVDGSRSCSRKWRLEGRIPSRKCCDHNHGGGARFRDLDFKWRHLKSAMGRFRSWALAPKADVGLQPGKRSPSTSARGGKRTLRLSSVAQPLRQSIPIADVAIVDEGACPYAPHPPPQVSAMNAAATAMAPEARNTAKPIRDLSQ